ncbi:hypothetical protein WA577_002693 [Blastocystis sp. JDR]
MVEKAPIVKEYKRAGTFWGMRGTRVLRLVTTFLTIGVGYYCLLYVPFDESHGDNMFTPIRRYYFKKRDEFFGVKSTTPTQQETTNGGSDKDIKEEFKKQE